MLYDRISESLTFAEEAYVNKGTTPPVVLTMSEANAVLVALAELSDEGLAQAFVYPGDTPDESHERT